MDFKDIFLTPIYLGLIYFVAFLVRDRVSNALTKKYFFTALHLKFIGAILVGLIYQFYYGYGDSLFFFRQSKIIWEAFLESPWTAIKILWSDANTYQADIYNYTSRIYHFRDANTWPVVKITGFLNLFSFCTYTVNAIFFATICFTGLWALYSLFVKLYPQLARSLFVVFFGIPSVAFWGSGLLKDTITLGAICWLTYSFYKIFFERKKLVRNIIILIISAYILQSIKVYLLLSFIPAAFIWLLFYFKNRIRTVILRILLIPVFLSLLLPISYQFIQFVTEDNQRYALENITYTAQETASWIKSVGERSEGSVYTLGESDGSFGNMLVMFPKAVWVSLFRPYLWESNSLIMLFAAIESLLFLIITIHILWEVKLDFFRILFQDPLIAFCLTFSIILAFGVGVSSYNFGSLARYKIPLLPFYLFAFYLIRYYANKSRKLL